MSSVLITGCSSGFGELAALTFARNGWRVVATMRRPGSSERLRAAAAEGLPVEELALDVCDATSVQTAVAEAIRRCGRLDAVVNNAGIEVFGAVHLLADDEVARQFDTNVTGIVRVARSIVPHFLEHGGGTIVNVGSVAGFVGAPYSGLYAASKHAVEALSEAMHFELSQRGVRVRVVEPGQFATQLGAKGFHAAAMTPDTDEYRRWQQFRTAQRTLVNGEPADPQQVADTIYRAVVDEPGQLRHLVGADAELIVGTKSSMPFEQFDATMRVVLNWHE
jgi:NAD(P)-dependent dehydrogenase (short-subunit alcohol dehydrogenase family)